VIRQVLGFVDNIMFFLWWVA